VLESIGDPRLRQNALNFGFQIVSSHEGRCLVNATDQQQVTRFFLTGLKDVWSAIRKDTGIALKKWIMTSTVMPMEWIEKLLETLITTALTEEKNDK
jgi:hypothetical protein